MSQPFIEQLRVGKPKTYGQKGAKHPMDREWTSGIVKQPVKGKVWVSETGLGGDGQGDTKNHGGAEKAMFAYPVVHYHYWQGRLDRDDFTIGAFGENLAVRGMTEAALCVGDIFQIGDVVAQVSQPRRPCWRPARRWRIKDLSVQIQNQGLTGWYFRILQEGWIGAGDVFELRERPYPEWTVARCNDVMHHQKRDLELANRLASCELLAPSWRNSLSKRVKGKKSDVRGRVIGPNE